MVRGKIIATPWALEEGIIKCNQNVKAGSLNDNEMQRHFAKVVTSRLSFER